VPSDDGENRSSCHIHEASPPCDGHDCPTGQAVIVRCPARRRLHAARRRWSAAHPPALRRPSSKDPSPDGAEPIDAMCQSARHGDVHANKLVLHCTHALQGRSLGRTPAAWRRRRCRRAPALLQTNKACNKHDSGVSMVLSRDCSYKTVHCIAKTRCASIVTMQGLLNYGGRSAQAQPTQQLADGALLRQKAVIARAPIHLCLFETFLQQQQNGHPYFGGSDGGGDIPVKRMSNSNAPGSFKSALQRRRCLTSSSSADAAAAAPCSRSLRRACPPPPADRPACSTAAHGCPAAHRPAEFRKTVP